MDTEALIQLASGVRGSVVAPGSPTYDDARRVWNGAVDKRPGAIVTCLDSADVMSALEFARAHDLGVSVRSSGHHVAGSAVLEGGLVIDLSSMRQVTVDRSTGRVRAQGGARIGDVDQVSQAHGLAVPLGLVSETGVAGLTLAGGYGWMRRKHGLSCDNVVSADLITADGHELHVDAQQHPDLFWALRGGGWDLGVVIQLEYQAHAVGPEVYLPFLTFPLAEAASVLAELGEFIRTAPLGLSPLAVCWTFPEADDFPRDLWGEPFVALTGPYIGDPEEGRRACEALADLGTVLTDSSDVLPWVDVQRLFDGDYPRGRRYHWRSVHLEELTGEVTGLLSEIAARRPSQLSSLDVWFNGGAIADVAADATPVGNRAAPNMIGIEANWEDPGEDEANIAWARQAAADLEPYAMSGAYLNFDDLSDPDRTRAARGESHSRLADVKHAYDPTNLFRSHAT